MRLRILVIISVLLFGCEKAQEKKISSVSTVDEIKIIFIENTPKGMDKEDVIAFLRHNDILFSQQPAELESPKGKEFSWLIAIIEPSQSIFVKKKQIQIIFYFNRQNNKLIETEIKEQFLSL